MAFKDVNEKSPGVKPAELDVGGFIEGYVVGFREGSFGTNIEMEIEGEKKTVYSSGNLKWIVKDNKLKVGLLTRITRLSDEVIKGPKGKLSVSKFKVEQDPDSSIAVAAQQAVTTSQEDFSSKIAAMKAKA